MGTKVNSTPRCVILGGGEISDYAAVSALLRADDYIICADSGYLHCKALSCIPDLLLGDFDSIGMDLPQHIARMDFPAEKNFTDGALAIQTAIDRGFRDLLLCGMLGGRLDHTLGSLQSLAACALQGIGACITDGRVHGRVVHNGTLVLQPLGHYYFSLLCLSEQAAGVTIRGAKYPLNEYTLNFYTPRAISNEFCGQPVTISVDKGTVLVLCVPMDK